MPTGRRIANQRRRFAPGHLPLSERAQLEGAERIIVLVILLLILGLVIYLKATGVV